MKVEVIKHAGKIAGYNFVPDNPAEEKVLATIADEKASLHQAFGIIGKNLHLIRQEYESYDLKTLEKLGEITSEEVKEEPTSYLACSECGSKDVQVKAWVYPNDNNSYAGDIDDGEVWCENCDEHVSLDLVELKTQKRKLE